MKVNFVYDGEKDIWCLLNKGRSSNNSQNPTKQYEQLAAECGENPTPEMTAVFIEKYLVNNQIKVQEHIEKFQKDWEIIAEEYHKEGRGYFRNFSYW